MARATFTVGVFGLACWNDRGTLRIKVNVRTDQEAQRKKIGLPNTNVKVIDMPGGGVEMEDLAGQQSSLLVVLRREIAEETGGCSIDPIGDFSAPYMAVLNTSAPERVTGLGKPVAPVKCSGRLLPFMKRTKIMMHTFGSSGSSVLSS